MPRVVTAHSFFFFYISPVWGWSWSFGVGAGGVETMSGGCNANIRLTGRSVAQRKKEKKKRLCLLLVYIKILCGVLSLLCSVSFPNAGNHVGHALYK